MSKFADKIRGRPLAEIKNAVKERLPNDKRLRFKFNKEVSAAPTYVDACTIIERWAHAHGINLEHGDLTALHTEELHFLGEELHGG